MKVIPKFSFEAMSCGCAVIGTDVQGIRIIIVDGVNGLLVPEDSKIFEGSYNQTPRRTIIAA